MKSRQSFPILLSILLLFVGAGCRSPRGAFVIGLYGVSQTNLFPEVRQAGVDVITGPASQAWLDAARASGLRVFASMGTTAGLEFNPAIARRTVQDLDRHPALWAWYLIDEPDLNAIHPELVVGAYRFLKRIPARKPVGVVLQNGGESLNFARGSDLLLVDRYPVAWQPLSVFEQHVRMARLGAGENRPLYAVVQAFDWSYFKHLVAGESGFRSPTREEMRCMTYGALAQGANGVFYYSLNSPPWDIREHPETWEALKGVLKEVDGRRGLFEAEHLWWPWKSSLVFQGADRLNENQESRITLAWLRVGSTGRGVVPGEYVLAVNNSPHQCNVRIFLPRRTGPSVGVLGTSEQRKVEENWLKETFEPYGVRVFGPLPTDPAP